MKKRAAALILLSLLLFSLAANSQDYYAVSSREWKAVENLCHYAGVTGPSSNGPVTKNQLLTAMERAEDELGADDGFLVYVYSLFTDEDATVTDGVGSVTISLEGNIENYAMLGDAVDEVYGVKDRYFFLSPSRSRMPLFNIGVEFNLLEYAYGRFNYNFARDEFEDGIWNSRFSTNISTVFSQSFPYDAGISIGTDNLHIMAARGRASLGEGYTGNTAVGDNYDYQEFVKASIFSPYMGFYLRLTSFDSSHDASLTDNPYALVSSRFSGWKQLRHEVGLEILFTKNTRLSASLINLIDTSSSFDVRMLNPFSIIHNMFNFTDHTVFESNNLLSADFSISPAAKWNLYFQFTLDQSQSRGEVEAYGEKLDPNAFGYLFNVSYSEFISDGILNIYFESVYTDPGMYLNSKFYASADDDTVTATDNGRYCWSQDWLLGYWRSQSYGDVSYSGYVYGPDCIVVALGGEYIRRIFSVEGRVMYMAHGEKGRGTGLSNYTFAGIDSRSTYNSKTPYGTVEHTVLVSAVSECEVTSYLSLSLGAAYSYIFNYSNESGRNRSMLELVFGVTIKGTVPTILGRDK